MNEPLANLEIRHLKVAESVALSPVDDGVFIALAEPLPVRTVLTVVQGDERRALEVTRVVEVAERDEHGRRGMYGRWADDEAIARASKVGSEHLEDGTPQVQPVEVEHSAAIAVSDAPVMGMAAPVLIASDDTGVLDVDEREYADDDGDSGRTLRYGETAESLADQAEASGEDATEDEGSDDGSGDAEAEAGGEDGGEASEGEQPSGRQSKGGKRKRGRRRR